MTADGAMVGRVQQIDDDVAHVKPEQDLDGSIRQKLGWASEGEDVYELPHSSVDSIDDRGIHLKEDL